MQQQKFINTTMLGWEWNHIILLFQSLCKTLCVIVKVITDYDYIYNVFDYDYIASGNGDYGYDYL